MHYLIVIQLSTFALVAATPTRATAPRSCTTLLPAFLQTLNSANPDTSYQNTALPEGLGNFFVYETSSNDNNPEQQWQFVDFAVPTGSYGCQLSITLPPTTYPSTYNGPDVWPALNVISLIPNALRANPTWNHALQADPSVISSHAFGTITPRPGTTAVINSEACPPSTENGSIGHLQFVFAFPSDMTEYDYVGWLEEEPYPEGQQLGGVYLTYNC